VKENKASSDQSNCCKGTVDIELDTEGDSCEGTFLDTALNQILAGYV